MCHRHHHPYLAGFVSGAGITRKKEMLFLSFVLWVKRDDLETFFFFFLLSKKWESWLKNPVGWFSYPLEDFTHPLFFRRAVPPWGKEQFSFCSSLGYPLLQVIVFASESFVNLL